MKKVFIGLMLIVLVIIMLIVILPKKYTVLTYHDFTKNNPSNNMQKNIKDFEKEMKFLYRNNYKTLTLKDVECFYDRKCKLPKKSVLITMDDGWKNEYKLALPILKKYKLNAVIFYVGNNYDGKNKNFINKKDIVDIKKNYKNIEIACHTYSNHEEEAYLKSENDLNKDFKEMKKIVNTKYFAYPYGKYSKNYIKVLKSNGYKLAFGFGPGKNHRKFSIKDNRYKVPRINVSTTYPYYKFILRLILLF